MPDYRAQAPERVSVRVCAECGEPAASCIDSDRKDWRSVEVAYVRADAGAVTARATIARIDAGEHDEDIDTLVAAARARQVVVHHARGQ